MKLIGFKPGLHSHCQFQTSNREGVFAYLYDKFQTFDHKKRARQRQCGYILPKKEGSYFIMWNLKTCQKT